MHSPRHTSLLLTPYSLLLRLSLSSILYPLSPAL
jgi:hypothetical protein